MRSRRSRRTRDERLLVRLDDRSSSSSRSASIGVPVPLGTARRHPDAARRHQRPRLGARRAARRRAPAADVVDRVLGDLRSSPGIVYLVLYPGFGALRRHARLDIARRAREGDRRRTARSTRRCACACAASRSRAIAGDPDALRAAGVLFVENCAACHGRDARGNVALGAPDLTDARLALRRRRQGDPREHPRRPARRDAAVRAAAARRRSIIDVAHYVASLSGTPHDSLRAQIGKPLFVGLRRLPRRRRQGQPGARRAQPHRRACGSTATAIRASSPRRSATAAPA